MEVMGRTSIELTRKTQLFFFSGELKRAMLFEQLYNLLEFGSSDFRLLLLSLYIFHVILLGN